MKTEKIQNITNDLGYMESCSNVNQFKFELPGFGAALISVGRSATGRRPRLTQTGLRPWSRWSATAL